MSRLKVLVVILLISLVSSVMLHGFKMITVLWSVHIVQETLMTCPRSNSLFTEIDFGYPEVGHRNELKQGLDVPTI